MKKLTDDCPTVTPERTTSIATGSPLRSQKSGAGALCGDPVVRQFDGVTLYNADCLSVLPNVACDAVVTDPPYGISWQPKGPQKRGSRIPGLSGWSPHKENCYGKEFDPIEGDDRPFDPEPILLGKHQVIWGAHVFYNRLPGGGSMFVWDKSCGSFDGVDFGQCEVAWKSWGGAVRIHRQKWMGLVRSGRERFGAYNHKSTHPNEKPVKLLEWCIRQIPGNPQIILDPFMGSGSTGLACIRTGRKFIGIEKDMRHFETACRRIATELAQGVLLPATAAGMN